MQEKCSFLWFSFILLGLYMMMMMIIQKMTGILKCNQIEKCTSIIICNMSTFPLIFNDFSDDAHSTVLPNFQFQFSGKIHLAFVAHAFYSYPIPTFFSSFWKLISEQPGTNCLVFPLALSRSQRFHLRTQ